MRFNDGELKLKYKFLKKQVKKAIKLAIGSFERQLALDAKRNPKRIYAYINSMTNVKKSIIQGWK